MILRSLRLRSFRAHAETSLEFAPKVNLLYGPNGAGKTNVLEAVHYLCLTKSFTASTDRYAVREGAPYFEIEGTVEGVREKPIEVRIVYVPSEGKKVFINGAPLDRLTEIVGMLPVVVFSPEDYDLTAGGPSERRRFVNNILSQARPVYMDDLMKYRRARKQRNEVLRQYKGRRESPPSPVLKPWTEEIVSIGSRVIQQRHDFLHTFSGYLADAYRQIEAVAEKPSIEYDTIADVEDLREEPDAEPGNEPPPASREAVADAFREALDRKRDSEERRGTTLVGPQRDELVFRLDDLEVRRYGSQGQHRTFGMALKLAQFFYLRDRADTEPLLLLDDAFGKLDRQRTDVFLRLLNSDDVGQSLVTATQHRSFAETLDFHDRRHRAFRVERVDQKAQVRPADAGEDAEAEAEEGREVASETAPAEEAGDGSDVASRS
jgi:DNA replication and repair protein RecF